jgi:hypothetical protein
VRVVHGFERRGAELRIPGILVDVEAGAEANQRGGGQAPDEHHHYEVKKVRKTVRQEEVTIPDRPQRS